LILLHALAAAVIIACALYMILSRNLVRILLGLALMATGVNVMLFVVGGNGVRQPPLIRDGEQVLGPSADPTSQALILTAIVIGFALTIVLATIVLRGWRSTGSLDARDLEATEQQRDAESIEPAS